MGDFTQAASRVQNGQKAYLDGPYGAFSIDRHSVAPGYVFVAGGVGIVPIMSMLRTLADRNDRRPITLFYGNARWERVLYREELEMLSTKLDLNIVHIIGEHILGWQGEHGLLTQSILDRNLPVDRGELQYFICGPTVMTQLAERWLAALGIRPSRIHNELFEWV